MKPLLTGLLAVAVFASTTPGMAKTKSCKAFTTQAQAQAYYNQRKKAGLTGWKKLDRDHDGQACDCLPGGNGTHCPKKH